MESARHPDIKRIQIQLTGFLEKDTPAFTKELWKLCLSAQDNPQGVPKELLEAKKLELIQEKVTTNFPPTRCHLADHTRLRKKRQPKNVVDAKRQNSAVSETWRRCAIGIGMTEGAADTVVATVGVVAGATEVIAALIVEGVGISTDVAQDTRGRHHATEMPGTARHTVEDETDMSLEDADPTAEAMAGEGRRQALFLPDARPDRSQDPLHLVADGLPPCRAQSPARHHVQYQDRHPRIGVCETLVEEVAGDGSAAMIEPLVAALPQWTSRVLPDPAKGDVLPPSASRRPLDADAIPAPSPDLLLPPRVLRDLPPKRTS